MTYKNFTYSLPTKIIYGNNAINNLSEEIKIKKYKKILLVYGKKAIKHIGLYENIVNILRDYEQSYIELKNCPTNPDFSFVEEGKNIVKDNKIDFILGIGGGSVIDASKAIALYSNNYRSGSLKKYMQGKINYNKDSIDVGAVLTIAATGSENNGSFIIKDNEENNKYGKSNLTTRPKFAICDPQYTIYLDKYKTYTSVSDILSHCFEQLFSLEENTEFIDNLIVATIKTVINETIKLEKNTEDSTARANIMRASSFALSYFLSTGKTTDWIPHIIEHSISGLYNTNHGEGLSIIIPEWLKLNKNNSSYYSRLKLLDNALLDSTDNNILEYIFNFYKNMKLSINLRELTGEESINIEHITENVIRNKENFNVHQIYKEDVENFLNRII